MREQQTYWTAAAPLPAPPAAPLPAAVDVLVVGGGYTGLSAARETASAGRRTLVLDRGAIGGGCSGMNGGQVAYSFKPGLTELTQRHGAELGLRVALEARHALDYLRDLIERERLDCDWQPRGTFVGAHTPRALRALCAEAARPPDLLGQRISIIARADVRTEIASERYHGGAIYHDDASVHPAKLLHALFGRAVAAGAECHDHCEVLHISRSASGFEVETSRGRLRARRILIATNGYSGPVSPWHRRRVIPIGSYQIATEPLGIERVRELIPNFRNVGDTRRVVIYLRPSPDGTRILFGGRAALGETDASRVVPRLLAMMTDVFPSLAGVTATHAWMGFVGFTFDTMPHIGERDGLYHCLGYCGQGVPTATYFGMRVGQQMADKREGRTALDGLPFPSRPFYYGKPWFLAPSILAYRALDRLGL